jgi:hypothetical protein
VIEKELQGSGAQATRNIDSKLASLETLEAVKQEKEILADLKKRNEKTAGLIAATAFKGLMAQLKPHHQKMNLYKCTTKNGTEVYIEAETVNGLDSVVKEHFDKLDWFLDHERKVIKVELVAKEFPDPEYYNGTRAWLIPANREKKRGPISRRQSS